MSIPDFLCFAHVIPRFSCDNPPQSRNPCRKPGVFHDCSHTKQHPENVLMLSMNAQRQIWALSAFFLLAFSGQTQRLGRPDQASPIVVIPFREMAGHIYVKATIGGLRDLSVVIDTGSPYFGVSQKIYERLKLPLTGMVNMPPGFGGRTPIPIVTTSVPSVSFGGLKIKNLRSLVLPLASIQDASGVETDAIIGSDLFSRYVVQLDYAGKVLRLYDPAEYPEPQGGCRLPLYVRMYPLVRAEIMAASGKSVHAVLFLDTGGEIPMLTKSFIASHPDLPLARLSPKPEQGRGLLGSTTRFRIGRVLGIRLGTCTIHDPIVAFSEDTTGMGLGGSSFSGEIGLSIFRRFTTIFDYRGGFVVFQSNTTPPAP